MKKGLNENYIENVCRCCLTKKNPQSMLEAYNPNKTEINSMEMYDTCISVQVNDELPKKICYDCLEQLSNAYNFRLICLESIQTLNTLLKYVEPEECDSVKSESPSDCNDFTDSNVAELRGDAIYEMAIEDKNVFECANCDLKFNSKVMLSQHAKLMMHKRKREFVCEHCSKRFTMFSYFKQHMLLHKERKAFKCDLCDAAFDWKSNLSRHYGRKHVKSCSVKEASETIETPLRLSDEMSIDNELFKCLDCDATFSDRNSFKLHAKQLGHKRGDFVCKVCSRTFSMFSHYKTHILAHGSKKAFKCTYCDKAFDYKSNLGRHYAKEHVDSNDKSNTNHHQCKLCQKNFKSDVAFDRHMRTHDENCDNDDLNNRRKDDFNVEITGDCDDDAMDPSLNVADREICFVCFDCNETFDDRDTFRLHVKDTMHSKKPKFVCHTCHKQYTNLSLFKDHLLQHKSKQPFRCRMCKRRFDWKTNLQRHYNRDHNVTKNGRFQCDLCPRRFDNRVSLRSHLHVHSTHTIKCSSCVKLFKSKCRFIKHAMKEHSLPEDEAKRLVNSQSTATFQPKISNDFDSSKFTCDLCSKSFSTKSALNYHYKRHGERTFLCTKCGKSFVHKDDLKRHFVIHTGDRKFKCRICGKCYLYRTSLAVHYVKHADVKPHKCETCEKRFVQKSALRAHMKAHNGIRLTCELCHRNYTTAWNLKLHMKTHAELMQFCAHCPRGFDDSAKLKNHEQLHFPQKKGHLSSFVFQDL